MSMRLGYSLDLGFRTLSLERRFGLVGQYQREEPWLRIRGQNLLGRSFGRVYANEYGELGVRGRFDMCTYSLGGEGLVSRDGRLEFALGAGERVCVAG
jgi:hypothetical protein